MRGRKRKKETECRPWWDKGEELRRHFTRAFRRSYHLRKTQANFLFDLEQAAIKSFLYLLMFALYFEVQTVIMIESIDLYSCR